MKTTKKTVIRKGRVEAAKPAKKASVKLAKTVTHQASSSTKAKVKAKKSKPVAEVTLKPGQTSMAITFEQEREKSYPVVVMAPQTTPNGKTGPYAQILFDGSKSILRPSGHKQKVEKVITDQTTGKEKTIERMEDVMTTVTRPCLLPVWCRVIKGDERNGVGVVYIPRPDVHFLDPGMKFRFAGGTAQTFAKAVEALS